MSQFLNTANAVGTYQGMTVSDSSLAIVELSAISVVKTAQRRIWNDGDMGFTITVTNVDTGGEATPITNVTVTDMIPVNIATIIDGSVTITVDDIPIEPPIYTYEGGLFSVTFDELEPESVAVINFRCNKAAT